MEITYDDIKHRVQPPLDCSEIRDFRGECFHNRLIINYENTDFAGCVLYHCYPSGLTNAIEVNPAKSKDAMTLRGADLQGANFGAANLTGANFKDADLQGANFGAANLTDVNFKDANLQSALFYNANLRNANFQGADLRRANFMFSDYRGANFQKANLLGAAISIQPTHLETSDFRKALVSQVRVSLNEMPYEDTS